MGCPYFQSGKSTAKPLFAFIGEVVLCFGIPAVKPDSTNFIGLLRVECF